MVSVCQTRVLFHRGIVTAAEPACNRQPGCLEARYQGGLLSGRRIRRVKKDAVLVVVSYALIYVVWGSTYFFIKAAVATIPPTIVVGIRFLSGALLLAVIARLRGGLRRLPDLKEIAGAALIGMLLLLLGNGLVTFAERTIPSWTASVVIACMPIYVAFFNLLLYRAKVSPIRLLGAFAGVAGVGLLLFQGSNPVDHIGTGMMLAIAGALSWGFGTSIAKSLPKPADVLVSTSIQMIVAGTAALVIGAASGVDIPSSIAHASAWSIFSLAYLAVFPRYSSRSVLRWYSRVS
ncbi:MAG: hypothetical protein CVV51_07800 [Spirochaetae bacterium HGW-Spirochaetae-7]|nr:MAG: hypothetical protein CVV51_07800 [Spirochaetae bacterium HGW-Spirochaetae-7]